MRATLKQMCVEDNLTPERFALFHNGISVFSRRAERTDGELRLRDPYVLNGCQTIKNAFLFKEDGSLKSKIKDDRWRRVAVPIRVIETNDDELVRLVTVNNNRQNAMSASALRSNDPVQIRLEQRFKRSHIFYQRQEGAFANIWQMQPELFEDEYENTRRTWVDINEIARAIAAAAGEIRLALRPNDLFESDTAYERCFNENTRLRSIVFLTFLQNLYDTIPIVLKKGLNLQPKVEGGPKPSYFMFHALCLLTRFLAREKSHDFVANWGAKLHFRDKDFREAIRKILNANTSGIRKEIAHRFMALGSTEADGVNAAFEECKRALDLKDQIKPFDVFAKLDEEDNEESAD